MGILVWYFHADCLHSVKAKMVGHKLRPRPADKRHFYECGTKVAQN